MGKEAFFCLTPKGGGAQDRVGHGKLCHLDPAGSVVGVIYPQIFDAALDLTVV